jgi:dipeptidyl aminopeptidase/acylaminoacyl peptidase
MQTMRSLRFVLLAGAAFAALAQTPKRPINHRDYDSWHTIQTPTLSRDGKFLAYSAVPEEGDGDLVVRNLATGKELKEDCGATPPAPAGAAEEPTEGPPVVRSIRIAFTHDNAFLIATSFPFHADTEKARKEHKGANEMPRPSLLIVNLATLTASRIPDVESFQLPELGDGFVACLHGAKPAAGAGAAPSQGDSDQDQRAGRGGAGAGRGGRNRYGSDLVLRDLRSGQERTFEDVLEYSFPKDGKALLYGVGSRKAETDGVYAVTPGNDAAPTALLAGKGRYTKFTWDLGGRELAFLSDRDDQASKPPKFKAYLWDRSGAPAEIISTATPGFESGFGILDRGAVSFSRDGSRLFVSCAPLTEIEALEKPPAPPVTAPSDEKVIADLWNWRDDYVQPMQKVRAAQDRSRSYRAVYTLADHRFLQLSGPDMAGLTPSDDGRVALGTDDRSYRRMVDYDGSYNNVYLVDTSTGSRKLVFEKFRGGAGGGGGRGGFGGGPLQLAPDGRHVLAYKDKAWWSIQVPDGQETNLTAKLGIAFYNEDTDTPEEPPSYGAGGWTKDGKLALLYDRYDVWAVGADGGSARKLTDGRKAGLQFRTVRLESDADEEERGIDPAKPLFLRAEDLETRDTGFYRMNSLDAVPQKLIMGHKNYRVLGKAKESDVLMVTATTFHDEPDIYVGDSSFRDLKQVTEANPQKKELLWGTAELLHYRNADGVVLEAALYKPENFDPSKKYPMLAYLYERLSQNVNNFVNPAPGHSINIAYYVSNGYLVLTPDIVYTTGHPGESALKCILPAVQTVVDKGFVNRDAIGIQGHSWGGYQTAYLITQTSVFKAAEAGAPVANMISAYDGIRWGSGLPRQFQYEKTQSRIGGSVWEYPLRFIENSPIFMIDRVSTPVLILANDADDAVPWYQGIEFFLGLRRLGKEAYLFNYNGEPHHINRRPNQKDYTVRMQQFFDHFLKGAPEPEWMQKGIPYIDRDQEKETFNGAVYNNTEGDKK